MIRFLFKVIKWVVILAVVLVALLLMPVGYNELACVTKAKPSDYTAILPEEHHREEARTLLTYPEWHIVHTYDDYAEVIRDGDPHEFSYVSAIRTYWTSLCALKIQSASHGGMDVSTSQLVYVIGASFTAELGFKAAYEETLGRLTTIIRRLAAQ